MPKYRVKSGMYHGVGGKYGPGEIVEIDELSAYAFRDKLESVKTPSEVVEEDKREYGVVFSTVISSPMPDATTQVDSNVLSVHAVFGTYLGGLLSSADLNTLGSVADATDDELRAITGIGPKTIMLIRTVTNDMDREVIGG